MPSRPILRRVISLMTSATLAILLCLCVAPATPAAPEPDNPVLRPAGTDGAVAAAKSLLPSADYEPGRYIVVLRDPAAANYAGGLNGLKPTGGPSRQFVPDSTRTRAYTDYLSSTQREVAASVGATRLASYSLTTNGFAANLTATQAARLATDPRVAQLVENKRLHVTDATTSTGYTTSTDYLGLEGEGGVWDSIGGPGQAGQGIVAGIIDTGIAPENPSFAGAPLGTTNGAAPYRDGDTIVFHKSDGSDFTGVCQTGEQFTADDCSTKIIGARYFVEGFGLDNLGDASIGEYVSPRDGGSHGSHTASTAAGDNSVATGGPTISGVAPAAKLAVYKACWSGPVPTSRNDDGCATIDLLSAIEAAVSDNVDVINYSIGGGPAATTNSLIDQAFMAAATAGIFVAAAGGNAGPSAATVDNASPWITTAAASTIPSADATVELGDGTAALGVSVTVPADGLSGPFVAAASAGAAGATQPQLCGPDSLDPATVTGAIVLCKRGTYPRLAKSAEVARAGGIGMVLVNAQPNSTNLDAHSVPTVHVDARYGDLLADYAATTGATATLVRGNTTDDPSAPTPQVAGFSSRGPVDADGSDLIKPDIAAPGVNIFAAEANPADGTPTWGYMSGTSMASPHVAGLGALYLSTQPEAEPAEVKSAMMTTAVDTVDDDGEPAADPFAQGNGQVTPTSYLQPGLLYLNDVDDWNGYLAGIGEPSEAEPIDPSDLNLPSIGVGSLAGSQTVTRTVTATAPGDYTADVTGVPGIDVVVEPSTLHFDAAGEQHTFTVTFTRTDATLGDFTTGYLTWTDGDIAVRSALAVRPIAFDAPDEVAGTGTTGAAEMVTHIGAAEAVDVTASGLARGSRVTATGHVGGASHRYGVEVPAGASYLRFDLDAVDDTADLDLVVYRKTAYGLTLAGRSATVSADERVDIGFVPGTGGSYVVDVDFYAAGSSGSDLAYTLTSYVVRPDAGLGSLTVDPTTIDGAVGDTPTVTASWSGLEPGHYLGLVEYGDTGVRTVLSVDAGEEVPVDPGTPELATPAEWTAYGEDLAIRATGLTPGVTYTASADGTVLRTGTPTAQGKISWLVTLTEDLAVGEHELALTGGDTTLTAPFKVSPVSLRRAYGLSSTGFDGVPRARIESTYYGRGGASLRFHLQSAETGEVFLDEVQTLRDNPRRSRWGATSPTVPVAAGEVVGSVTVVLPDGTDGPSLALDPFHAESAEPGTIKFTPRADDPDVVDVAFVNHTGRQFNPTVRYYGADGRQVFANGFIDNEAESSQRWDLTGFERVEILQDDQILAAYTNQGPGREDTSGISVYQNYWATFTATGDTSAEKPITMAVSHRYAPYSKGFDINIGEGDHRFAEDPFFHERIPTDVIEERGPVISRSVAVREGVGHWAVSYYEQDLPIGIHLSAMTSVEAPPLTRDELTTATTTDFIRAGMPTVRGKPFVGSTLRAKPGKWRPSGVTLSYQWLRDGAMIAGADDRHYRLTQRDAGHRIRVRVTGTLGSNFASATSHRAVKVKHH